jgi:hypothetical protein
MSARLLALTLLCAGAGAAHAESDIFSPEVFHGLAEVGLVASDTENSWVNGGYGKTGIERNGLQLNQAALEWRPNFSFAVSGVVYVQYQPRVSPQVDIGEAFLKVKAPPTALGRLSFRGGVFYPPVSQEHGGVAWTTPDMLTGSALNSWIGEEVKVAGLETTLQRALGSHDFEVNVGVFGWNDTSGTLLTFRGWSPHGIRSGLHTEFPLPPLSMFASWFQPQETYPLLELDDRAGYYARIAWRPPAPVSFSALYYDNAGNRTAVDKNDQWAWETRFLNLGMTWEPSETTKVIAQAMSGETIMGYRKPVDQWFDMGFRSAFVLATHKLGDDAISGRVEWFDTDDRSFVSLDDNNEKGWALTAAWRHRLVPHADVVVEAQRIASDRPSRVLAHDSAKQDESVLQAALRLSF